MAAREPPGFLVVQERMYVFYRLEGFLPAVALASVREICIPVGARSGKIQRALPGTDFPVFSDYQHAALWDRLWRS